VSSLFKDIFIFSKTSVFLSPQPRSRRLRRKWDRLVKKWGKKINRAVRRNNVRTGGDQIPSHSLPISMPPVITCGGFVSDNLIII